MGRATGYGKVSQEGDAGEQIELVSGNKSRDDDLSELAEYSLGGGIQDNDDEDINYGIIVGDEDDDDDEEDDDDLLQRAEEVLRLAQSNVNDDDNDDYEENAIREGALVE